MSERYSIISQIEPIPRTKRETITMIETLLKWSLLAILREWAIMKQMKPVSKGNKMWVNLS